MSAAFDSYRLHGQFDLQLEEHEQIRQLQVSGKHFCEHGSQDDSSDSEEWRYYIPNEWRIWHRGC